MNRRLPSVTEPARARQTGARAGGCAACQTPHCRMTGSVRRSEPSQTAGTCARTAVVCALLWTRADYAAPRRSSCLSEPIIWRSAGVLAACGSACRPACSGRGPCVRRMAVWPGRSSLATGRLADRRLEWTSPFPVSAPRLMPGLRRTRSEIGPGVSHRTSGSAHAMAHCAHRSREDVSLILAAMSDDHADALWEAFVIAMLAVGPVAERRSRYGDKPALFTASREIAHMEAPGVIDLRITRAGWRQV
jgi:hypothetical protein